jgi:L-lactate dehydrogenase complex protein LldG
MSTSRAEILKAIRRHLPESSPLPPLDGPWIQYPNPMDQFDKVLQMIGGRMVHVPHLEAVANDLQSLAPFAQSKKVLCEVEGLTFSPSAAMSLVDVDSVVAAGTMADVDFAILPGEFAVAENAAVWCEGSKVRHRAEYFICEHLALVVPAEKIVNNMFEAYQHMSFTTRGFGAFIAGPSKTADIEQSLVIGAHGPRSHTVYFVDQLSER